MSQVSEIKQALKNKKLIAGWNSVESAIKLGAVKKVFLSKSVSDAVRVSVMNYSKINDFIVNDFSGDAFELGVLCKKPFSVSVLAIKE